MLDGYRGNWLVRLMANGFESVMAVYGTEEGRRCKGSTSAPPT